jgi:hypothetical protein
MKRYAAGEAGNVQHYVFGSSYVFRIGDFLPTGGTTPAGGICYIHPTEDVCATVYKNSVRFYYNRKTGSETMEKWPCFYEHCRMSLNDMR